MKQPPHITAFIVSAPRSGSTWLQCQLSNLPQYICIESRPYGHFFEMWPEANGPDTPRITTDAFTNLLGRHLFPSNISIPTETNWTRLCTKAITATTHDLIRKATGKNIVIEKVTPYLQTSSHVLQSIAHDFPDAPVFQLIRDGRDVITSGFFHWINRNARNTARHRYFSRGRGRLPRRFFDDNELRKWCQYWSEPILAFDSNSRPHECIKYEEMKQNASQTLQHITTVIGTPTTDEECAAALKAASFETMSGGRRVGQERNAAHVRKGVTGDWKNYFTRKDGEIFLEETKGCLIRTGYETSDDWVKSLPNRLPPTSAN